jgi:hypothetical protein
LPFRAEIIRVDVGDHDDHARVFFVSRFRERECTRDSRRLKSAEIRFFMRRAGAFGVVAIAIGCEHR